MDLLSSPDVSSDDGAGQGRAGDLDNESPPEKLMLPVSRQRRELVSLLRFSMMCCLDWEDQAHGGVAARGILVHSGRSSVQEHEAASKLSFGTGLSNGSRPFVHSASGADLRSLSGQSGTSGVPEMDHAGGGKQQ